MREGTVLAFLGALASCGGNRAAADSPVLPAAPAAPAPAQTASTPRRPNVRLQPEVIQRLIREHFGVFRRCYEDGMRRDPCVRGAVTTKFVIDRGGHVASVEDGRDEPRVVPGEKPVPMPDQEVAQCVFRHFRDLVFPEPDGGIVTVVYPIMFNPDTDEGCLRDGGP